MVDISVYRHRIGTFRQVTRFKLRRKDLSTKCRLYQNIFMGLTILACLTLIFLNDCCSTESTSFSAISNFYLEAEVVVFVFVSKNIGNFFARYVYGNINKNHKGLNILHVNIRSLQNKVNEV